MFQENKDSNASLFSIFFINFVKILSGSRYCESTLMTLSYQSNMDPLPASCDSQLILTDSLMGFIYEQLTSPDFEIGPLLNPKPTTHHNEAPMPAQIPTLNPSPVTAPCIPSQHQDSYHTNAQLSCHENAEFTLNPFVKYHQTCNNHLSTASLTNQVNILYQNPSFPARPCTRAGQGRVSAFKCASAQSVAAKVRRKKISDKTQELGKLIPGGDRMNTAEMLMAAFKYVKFLQAQIGILAMMDSQEVIPLIFVLL